MIDRYDISESLVVVGLLLLVSGTLAVTAVNLDLGSVPNMFLLMCIPVSGLWLMVLGGLMEHYWNRKVRKK